MKKKIFVALDYNSLEKALDTSKKIKDQIAGVKIGTELYAVCGLKGLQKFKEIGVKIFLDLKLHDIPNTVKKSAQNLIDLKPDYLSIHLSGGLKMVEDVVSIKNKTKILGISMLTSLDNSDLVSLTIVLKSPKESGISSFSNNCLVSTP